MTSILASFRRPSALAREGSARELDEAVERNFVRIYDSYARFVFRAVVRLGVPKDGAEDAVQEVFLIVHRRLPDFRGESCVRTWLYGIAIRVARNVRRTRKRRPVDDARDARADATFSLPEATDRAPDELMARAQATQLLAALLDTLDDDLREVFVLSELEEISAGDIAEALGANVNTIYSRLRAARRAFEQAAARARARDEWRLR